MLLNNSGFVSSQNNDNNNNSQVKEEIKIENLYFELNDDENTYQKLWNATKGVLNGRLTSLKAES